MSSLTANPARRAIGTHRAVGTRRALVAAEAVVSAYINDLTSAPRPHEGAAVRPSCPDSSPRTHARTPLTARGRTRAAGPRRRAAVPMVA